MTAVMYQSKSDLREAIRRLHAQEIEHEAEILALGGAPATPAQAQSIAELDEQIEALRTARADALYRLAFDDVHDLERQAAEIDAERVAHDRKVTALLEQVQALAAPQGHPDWSARYQRDVELEAGRLRTHGSGCPGAGPPSASEATAYSAQLLLDAERVRQRADQLLKHRSGDDRSPIVPRVKAEGTDLGAVIATLTGDPMVIGPRASAVRRWAAARLEELSRPGRVNPSNRIVFKVYAVNGEIEARSCALVA